MDKNKLKEILYGELGDKQSHPWREKGGKYWHGIRTASVALKLRELIVPDDSSMDDILYAAALFHDVRCGMEDHEHIGAVRTRELISDFLTPDEMDGVTSLIEVHDQRISDRTHYNKWQKIVQDADLLDHHGIFRIWEKFMFAPFSNQDIIETLDELADENSDGPERSEQALNFEQSRAICRKRDEFVNAFVNRFRFEAVGGVWEEDKYLK